MAYVGDELPEPLSNLVKKSYVPFLLLECEIVRL